MTNDCTLCMDFWLQEMFDNMYSTPVSIEKGENISTRIRKV